MSSAPRDKNGEGEEEGEGEDAKLAEVLGDVPRGAWILAATSVGLLLFLWLLFSLFILGREPVG